ncbi:DNA repair protein RadA [Enemella sp. A6]|uniref:DNA repair protein RadA n=1 Tax=Enemella sp. A6 TaxID=3440152 RepID=UPI003EBBBC1E
MAKSRSEYRCTECGWTTVRWVGRCGECQTWGSVVESSGPAAAAAVQARTPATAAVPIGEVPLAAAKRDLTRIGELDRVLGGGLVPGAVVLLAGEPGVGKSTLLLDVAAHWARAERPTLYVTGEESAAQVRLRAERTGALTDNLWLAAEDDLEVILGHIEQVEPSLMVLDSVQTVRASADGSSGSVTQVREVTGALVRVAKRRGMAVMIVGHVTKDGAIAGPRLLEHLVDVVLSFEGDRHSGFRMVRATKNRFGPADEVGCFEMAEGGIVEVTDPSGLFTSHHEEPVPGTAVTVTLEGRRPLLAEVQALLAPTEQHARRTTQGVDSARVAMIVAVLQRRVRVLAGINDVYVSTVGGARVVDPAADLAIALALASANAKEAPWGRVVALGEVGLAGELRPVPAISRRLNEAARLGFNLAVVPARSEFTPPAGMRVIAAPTLARALAELDG